jgi:hypothetical protein
MVSSESHGHPHGRGQAYRHVHAHGLAASHPAQAAPWSILRMNVPARLGAVLAVIAGLWTVVWLAMR